MSLFWWFFGGISSFVIIALFTYYWIARSDAAKQRQAIDQAEEKVKSQPEKVKPAWDLARITLGYYFDRNLSQIRWIFYWCVIVMLIGFAIIGWGVTRAIIQPNSDLPAIIAGLAGVITELIGATFLFIYRSVIEQAASYTKTLERINSVGMAMQIIDTIPNNARADGLKNTTKALVVKMLMYSAYEIDDSRDADTEPSKIPQ